MRARFTLLGCILYLSNFIGLIILIILSVIDKTIYGDYGNQFSGFLYMNNLIDFFYFFIILQIIGIILVLIPAPFITKKSE